MTKYVIRLEEHTTTSLSATPATLPTIATPTPHLPTQPSKNTPSVVNQTPSATNQQQVVKPAVSQPLVTPQHVITPTQSQTANQVK